MKHRPGGKAESDIAITQDGRVIRTSRAAMRDVRHIVHFMAKDCKALALPPDSDDWEGLKETGWTVSQCRAHFRAALQQAHADSLGEIAANVMALILMLAAIAGWAHVFTA